MTLATVADVRAGYASSVEVRTFSKTTFSASTGAYASLWTVNNVPAAGAGPGTTAAVCTSATAGAIPFTNATVDKIRLYEFSYATGTSLRVGFLADRLAHVSGYAGTTTTTQSFGITVVGMDALRLGSADYSEIVWFVEWYTGTGNTVTATVTYTNGAGTSGRTTNVTFPSSVSSRRIVRVIGQDGEPIQSIQSALHATTGTAGDYGFTAVRLLSPFVAAVASEPYSMNWFETRLVTIPNNACLFFIQYISGTSPASLDGSLVFIDR